MLIVLEGPDGVGKTTLAGQLHNIIREQDPHSTIVIMRRGRPTLHPLDEYLTPLLTYRPGGNTHLILDRWHLGEYVYPRLSMRSTELDDQSWWYINQYIRRLGGLLVLCYGTADRVAEVYSSRNSSDPFERAELYQQTEKLFFEAVNSATLPQVLYDWNYGSLGVSPANIVQTAEVRERYITRFSQFTTFVGRQSSRYLLLGDVRHGLNVAAQRESRTDVRSAFIPFPATSGHWLLTALLTQPDLTHNTALANACDVDDVVALWQELGKPKVAALGANAHRELQRVSGIPYGRVPHPQFGRRFHHNNYQSYAVALLAALENQEDHSKWRGSLPERTAVTSTAKSSTPSAGVDPDATPATASPTT